MLNLISLRYCLILEILRITINQDIIYLIIFSIDSSEFGTLKIDVLILFINFISSKIACLMKCKYSCFSTREWYYKREFMQQRQRFKIAQLKFVSRVDWNLLFVECRQMWYSFYKGNCISFHFILQKLEHGLTGIIR